MFPSLTQDKEFVLRFRDFTLIQPMLSGDDLSIISTLFQTLEILKLLDKSGEKLMVSATVEGGLKYTVHYYPKPNCYLVRKHSKTDLTFIQLNDYYSKKARSVMYMKLTTNTLLAQLDGIKICMSASGLMLVQHLVIGKWKDVYQFTSECEDA